MKLFKRQTYDGTQIFWQIGNTDYYLSKDKTELFLFEPYTQGDNGHDIELFENESNGSTWKVTNIDLDTLFQDKKELLNTIKRHLKGIEKAVEKLEGRR
jgi:hypothetical protein